MLRDNVPHALRLCLLAVVCSILVITPGPARADDDDLTRSGVDPGQGGDVHLMRHQDRG